MGKITGWFTELYRVLSTEPVGGYAWRIVLIVLAGGFVAGALVAKAKLLKGVV